MCRGFGDCVERWSIRGGFEPAGGKEEVWGRRPVEGVAVRRDGLEEDGCVCWDGDGLGAIGEGLWG
jgi:hypothetical protein